MLPLYLFGNLHCMGMCGPLVMMIGRHRFRSFYFLGRLTSFSLAGMIAGEAGAVLSFILKQYHLPALMCFLFGGWILFIGMYTAAGWQYPGYQRFAQFLGRFNHSLSLLMLRDRAWPAFLFGFFTVTLPCGQTLIVFSACALAGNLYTGLLNGFAFALLTTPSLFIAMKAHAFFQRAKKHDKHLIGGFAVGVGLLSILRGFADMEWIPHLILNPQSPMHYHIVIY
jgi:sulfite exporter TauE/SafE